MELLALPSKRDIKKKQCEMCREGTLSDAVFYANNILMRVLWFLAYSGLVE
jgi:hypothetical protein